MFSFPRIVHTKPHFVTTRRVYCSSPCVRLKLENTVVHISYYCQTWLLAFTVIQRCYSQSFWERGKASCTIRRVGISYYFHLRGKITWIIKYRKRDIRKALQHADDVSNSETSKTHLSYMVSSPQKEW